MDARIPGQRGFTLVELLVVLVLIAVVLAGAVPAIDGLVREKRADGIERVFFTSLARAKQAAVTRRQRVALCPSRNGRACLPKGLWHQGWIMFVDADADRRPDPNESILERQGKLPDAVSLVSSRYRRVITFQPTGTAGGSNATFTLCTGGDPGSARAVVLSRLGRIRRAEADLSRCGFDS